MTNTMRKYPVNGTQTRKDIYMYMHKQRCPKNHNISRAAKILFEVLCNKSKIKIYVRQSINQCFEEVL